MVPGNYRSVSWVIRLCLWIDRSFAKKRIALIPRLLSNYTCFRYPHELARHKSFGIKTFQAEDEIAAITSAIGAAYGGSLGVTTTSGPGMALKAEAMGLAVMLEIPLLIAIFNGADHQPDFQQKQNKAICCRLIMAAMANVRCR